MINNPYSELVNQLRGLMPADPSLGRKVNELISVNELLTTLNTVHTLEETLELVLLTVLGEYPCPKGAIFIKGGDGWRLGIGRGLRNVVFDFSNWPMTCEWDELPLTVHLNDELGALLAPLFGKNLFELAIPIRNEGKLVGLIGLGKCLIKTLDREKARQLATIADFSGVIMGNHLYRQELELANRQLQRRLFQLNTLYEITGAFARCFENEAIYQILANNLMGHFFISRCALIEYIDRPRLSFWKGVKANAASLSDAAEPLGLEHWSCRVQELDEVPCPIITAFMVNAGLKYALPVSSEGNPTSLLLLGARLDRKTLAAEDRDFILSLSQQAAMAVENIRLQREELEKKRMEKELSLAREIQEKLIPKSVPILEGYEIAAEMRPFYHVGGDFYDFILQDNKHLSICLADVSGKSLPASMIMSTAQASLRALNSFPGLSPKDVIEKLNFHLYHATQSNKFVTMFYAVLDPANHCLHYINAGHNRPILIRPCGSTVLLDKGGMVVGLFPGASYQVGQIDLEPGTDILIYTDGLSEVMDAKGEEYGDDRLIEFLIKHAGKGTVEQFKHDIIHEVMSFSSGKMVDDMTLLLIRRKAVPC